MSGLDMTGKWWSWIMQDSSDPATEKLLDAFLMEAREVHLDKAVMRLVLEACLSVVIPGTALSIPSAITGTRKILEETNVRVIGLDAIVERLVIFLIDKGVVEKGEISQIQEEMLSILEAELSLLYEVKETDLLLMIDLLMKSIKDGRLGSIEELARLIHAKTFGMYSLPDLNLALLVLFERLAELGYVKSGKSDL